MMNYKLLILVALLLVSCSDDNQDLSNYIKQIKQKKVRELEPIPNFTPLTGFKFPENTNRRNPFKPTNQRKTVDLQAPDKHRAKQPLEAFPLDSLKFVGTLKQDNEIWALIKEPSTQITRVRVGDYMGQNYGRIILIRNDVMKLEETVKGPSGAWEKHVTTLELNTGK